MIRGIPAADTREEGEDGDSEEEATKPKAVEPKKKR